MYHHLYRVAFAIARHLAVGRGINHETPLYRYDLRRAAVQSLGEAGERPASLCLPSYGSERTPPGSTEG